MTYIRGINVDVDVDIDVEEFLDECYKKDIEQIIEWLTDNDYNLEINNDSNEDLIKLLNVISLTVEDEELIKQIANKYP